VDEDSRGDPESLLRWTAKSLRQVASALREMGHEVHFTSVAAFMRLLGYSLQAKVKTKDGASHPDPTPSFGASITPHRRRSRPARR
jgi:Rhodopirellula transposase DDE domain